MKFPFLVSLISFIALLTLPGCPRPIPGPQPIPDEQPDADSGPTDPDSRRSYTCADACQRASQLGCSAAEPTPKGASCLEVCVNVMQSGVVTFNLACKSKATSCPAYDRCQ